MAILRKGEAPKERKGYDTNIKINIRTPRLTLDNTLEIYIKSFRLVRKSQVEVVWEKPYKIFNFIKANSKSKYSSS